MIHFIYLVIFSLFVAIAFAVFNNGTTRERVIYGVKTFLQFVLISLLLAWILYFIPW
jgi:hypothetical protein